MKFTKKQFLDLQPTSHSQKWTIDLLIRKLVANFKTPPSHLLPTFRVDVINVWSLIVKDLKKRKWVERLQTSKIKSFISFCNTLFWFVWQSQIYVIRIKNKICYMIGVMSFKCIIFFTVMTRDYLGYSQKSLVEYFCENS